MSNGKNCNEDDQQSRHFNNLTLKCIFGCLFDYIKSCISNMEGCVNENYIINRGH